MVPEAAAASRSLPGVEVGVVKLKAPLCLQDQEQAGEPAPGGGAEDAGGAEVASQEAAGTLSG